jgi:3-hydroxyisobutyrate/3-hydroxypropionate dehydrogenase
MEYELQLTQCRIPGLGVMGYPMAVNLRNGLSPDYTLLICDVNREAISKFQKQVEGKGPVKVITNGFEAANAALTSQTLKCNSFQIIQLMRY